MSGDLRLTVASAEKMGQKPDHCFKGYTVNNVYEVILVSFFPLKKATDVPGFRRELCWFIQMYGGLIHTVHRILSKSVLVSLFLLVN